MHFSRRLSDKTQLKIKYLSNRLCLLHTPKYCFTKMEETSKIETQLLKYIKQSLKSNGEYEKLKSSIRQNCLNIIRGEGTESIVSFVRIPDNLETESSIKILNNLISEYFQWIGYQYSNEILTAEAGVEVQKLKEQTTEFPQILEILMKTLGANK